MLKFLKDIARELKKDYKVNSYVFNTIGVQLMPSPVVLTHNFDFADTVVKDFLKSLSTDFWLHDTDYAMEFIKMNDDGHVIEVNLAGCSFISLMHIYLLLNRGGKQGWDGDQDNVFSGTVACIHEYVINCKPRLQKKVLKVLMGSVFGNLDMQGMEYHSSRVREYSHKKLGAMMIVNNPINVPARNGNGGTVIRSTSSKGRMHRPTVKPCRVCGSRAGKMGNICNSCNSFY